MMNCVMLVKDRPELTKQALITFFHHTDVPWNLTVIDDSSGPETRGMMRALLHGKENVAILRNCTSKGITGQVRNLGVYWSEKYFGRGDWLYLSDNDIAFLPQWASRMIAALDYRQYCLLLGGVRHPYHQCHMRVKARWQSEDKNEDELEFTDAVAGYSHLMSWKTWRDFGPFDAHAPGVCQSEDFKFSQDIIKVGCKVGYLYPPAIVDCGFTATDGSPAIGHESKPKVEGVLQK